MIAALVDGNGTLMHVYREPFSERFAIFITSGRNESYYFCKLNEITIIRLSSIILHIFVGFFSYAVTDCGSISEVHCMPRLNDDNRKFLHMHRR